MSKLRNVCISLYGDVVSIKACRSLTNNLNGIERLSIALELCGGLRSFEHEKMVACRSFDSVIAHDIMHNTNF
jgi:hypothetical protein